MAPPRRLNGRVEHEIATLISTGLPLATAARLVGVPPRTATDWYVQGRKGTQPHWARFAESVEAARVEHDREVVRRLAELRGRPVA